MNVPCPHCGRVGTLPDGTRPKLVRCPRCRREFAPFFEPEDDSLPGIDVEVGPSRPYSPRPSRLNPLGVASFVFGVPCLAIAWIPLLNFLALPLGAIGLILGVCALLMGPRYEATWAFVGLGMSAVAMWYTWAMYYR